MAQEIPVTFDAEQDCWIADAPAILRLAEAFIRESAYGMSFDPKQAGEGLAKQEAAA